MYFFKFIFIRTDKIFKFQGKNKIIPLTSSRLYGLPTLKVLDINLKEYSRRSLTKDFSRRNGLNIAPDIEQTKQVL